MAKISGRCLCGAVRYEGDVEPIFMGNCHCTDCRKSSGSGHMALISVPETAIAITGEVKAYELKADSGAVMTHNFCPNCGSQMFMKNLTMPGVMVLVAATLDDPEIYKPTVTVYASRALSWDKPHPGTEKFDEMPPMGG